MADSLYNIRLLREFSNEYLNRCFYLTLEDMLYAPPVLKVTMTAERTRLRLRGHSCSSRPGFCFSRSRT